MRAHEELAAAEGNMDGNEGELWVDKYRPRSYVDLLSDEV